MHVTVKVDNGEVDAIMNVHLFIADLHQKSL